MNHDSNIENMTQAIPYKCWHGNRKNTNSSLFGCYNNIVLWQERAFSN